MEEKTEKKRNGFISWLDNFWYYYKWHTVAVILVLLGIGYGIYTAVGRVPIDITVFYISERPIAYSEHETNLKNALKPYVRDYTGDGKVRIEFRNYYLGEDYGEEIVKENISNFKKEYTAGTVMLIVADKTGLDQLTEYGYFGDISDITPDAIGGVAWDAEGSAFKDSPGLDEWPAEMYWGVRVFNEKSLISISRKKGEEFAFAREVLTNIINDNKVEDTDR